ncbi:copper chaperone PCu(A)C [Mameliella sp. CS4]|uniref:copper chaperone PCu(A)C n=1 Tax=Mameliella sp. CS4 TaxID=2862329 RepID=UPI001C5FFB61|nr:copper chaperone PCu(A)C [Mameliella sp. CS4]MBW4984455.1 copper chaperone PCu(A)C [Mameliella sp. CS4]
MTRFLAFILTLVMPLTASAGDLSVTVAVVPLAPPGVMAHAAYFNLTNDGAETRRLIGVRAEGYAMAHLHRSEEMADVATMTAVDAIDIAPGQSIVFKPGGLHVMLMHPAAMQAEGDTVLLTLKFANGETLPVQVPVTRLRHGS